MLAPNTATPDDPLLAGITFRHLRPDDAAGVTRLVSKVYGDSYYPRDLYDPEQIIRLNDSGKLVSSVAVNAAGEVVGHYALERPHLEAVAEASDAIVLPEYRHHHVLERMRGQLRDSALAAGLTGLIGYAVTNHLFTQKAETHFGASPCGVALGLWPRSFHNMPEPLTQRMSFALYFQFLRQPSAVLHVATHHQEMIGRIYRQYGVTVETRADAPAVGPGELAVTCEPALGTAYIRIRRVGVDTPAAVEKAYSELSANSAVKALTLELPLGQPGAAAACRAAEQVGFYFSGLGPAFADDGDALLLQLCKEDIDPALIQIDHPFARALLDYAESERRRVRDVMRR